MVKTMSDAVSGAVKIDWIVGGLLPDVEALDLLNPLAVAVDDGGAPALEGLVGYEAE